jgi:hypothetical protein
MCDAFVGLLLIKPDITFAICVQEQDGHKFGETQKQIINCEVYETRLLKPTSDIKFHFSKCVNYNAEERQTSELQCKVQTA